MSAKIVIPNCLSAWVDGPYWVVWRFEKRQPDKEPTKVPYCPAEPSRGASHSDPTTWASSHLALQIYERSTGYFNGIMLALRDLPLIVFDIDDCIINAELHEFAQQLLARCRGTYVEVTPSGKALRVIGRGGGSHIHRKFQVTDGVSIELYRGGAKRFITLTGQRYGDAPDTLTDLNTLADEVLAELEAAKQQAKQAKQKPACGGKKKEVPPLEDIIKNGRFELWENDRSRGEYYVVNELIRLGKTDEDIVAIFGDVNNAIAAHCLSKPEKPRDYIMRTITRARAEADDVSADGSPDPDGAEIAALAAVSDIEYERQRADAAKRLGVRTVILDRLVQVERDRKRRASGDDDGTLQGHALKLDEPKPWDEAVNGAELLDVIANTIRNYVILEEWQARAIAVWILHTYLVDVFQFSPRLCITSPTKGCGKTTLLDTVSVLALRPLSAANVSTSSVFRVIEKCEPTLLIDEADSFVDTNNELRGVLNSGHRKGGAVLRVVGDDLEPRLFATYGACAIALIGALPSTLADRSITIELKRKRAGEKAKPFRLDRVEPLKTFARQCQRWAQDHAIEVGGTEASLPPEMINRAADNWRVLKQIAMVASGPWPDFVDAAARAAAENTGYDELLVQLLADIRGVEFAHVIGDENEIDYSADDEIPSAILVQKLIEKPGRPWAEMPGKDGKEGKQLSQNKLARLLKPLAIGPELIGPRRVSGYKRAHFKEVFERYLSDEGGLEPLNLSKPDEMGTSRISQPLSLQTQREVEKCKKPNSDGLMRVREVAHGGSSQGKPDRPANGEDKGLDHNTIGRLASHYRERFYEVRDEDEVDAWLYRALAECGVFPEFLKIEFGRVKDAVYAL
jgi:putative DNA primase/helicase